MKKRNKKKRPLRRREQLEKALGAAQRAQYLEDNPHGYSRQKSVHKDKNQYSRKRKHKKKDHYRADDGLFLLGDGNVFRGDIGKKKNNLSYMRFYGGCHCSRAQLY